MQNAMGGIDNLKSNVDTLIVIPNDKLLQIVDRRTTMPDALKKADEVLQQAVQGITDLINVPGLINLDFADVQTAMKDKGIAHIGIGAGQGDHKAADAVKLAVESPLLDTTIAGATDVIINVSGDIALADVSDATGYVQQLAGDTANIIFGAVYDETKTDSCNITVIATGIDDKSAAKAQQAAAAAAIAAAQQATAQAQAQMVRPTAQTPVMPGTGIGGFTTLNQPRTYTTPVQTASAPIAPAVPKTAAPVRPVTGLSRPESVRSTVEPKSLKIPEFLQRK
jgi:cell division protein FtsZ